MRGIVLAAPLRRFNDVGQDAVTEAGRVVVVDAHAPAQRLGVTAQAQLQHGQAHPGEDLKHGRAPLLAPLCGHLGQGPALLLAALPGSQLSSTPVVAGVGTPINEEISAASR